MDPALFERIARECAGRDTKLWLHFLGEPLLHRETPRLIALAKAAGVREVGLSTNAVSLHGPLAEAILASGLDRLECSMDALDRDGYVAMRGRTTSPASGATCAPSSSASARSAGSAVTSIQFMRTPAISPRSREVVDVAPVSGAARLRHDHPPGVVRRRRRHRHRPAGGGRRKRPPCPWLFDSR